MAIKMYIGAAAHYAMVAMKAEKKCNDREIRGSLIHE